MRFTVYLNRVNWEAILPVSDSVTGVKKALKLLVDLYRLFLIIEDLGKVDGALKQELKQYVIVECRGRAV